jgi:hypothetical protein
MTLDSFVMGNRYQKKIDVSKLSLLLQTIRRLATKHIQNECKENITYKPLKYDVDIRRKERKGCTPTKPTGGFNRQLSLLLHFMHCSILTYFKEMVIFHISGDRVS